MDISKLNTQQQLAVTTTEGPVLVIAGAGTGKTSVLTTRIAYIISKLSIDPNRILAFTFTNKAAEEMKIRINKMIPHCNAQWIRTYHGTCLKILKEDIGRLGWTTDFSIIDEEDQISLVKNIIKDYKILTKVQAKKIVKCIGEIKLDDIIFANHTYYDLAQKFEVASEQDASVIVKVFEIYNQRLKASNQLDFSDLINFVHKLFKENEDIRRKWQDRFDYVLIDEFQDTNMKQFDIIKYIVGNHNNVFAVGDPNQTIYTWRGAYPEIFDDFYNTYKGTKVIKLAYNYRSARNILTAANELISNNATNFKNDLIPMVPTDADVRVFIGGWQEDEANFVCSTINDFVKKYHKRYDDIVILYRANYCTRLIEEKLIVHQIPYVIFGSVNFYARKEIKDLISYLKMLYKPDDISAMRIINVPRRAIGIDTVDKISSWANEHKVSFVEALNEIESVDIPSAAKTKVKAFLSDLTKLRAKIDQTTWDRAIDVIVKEIKYIEWLQQSETEIEDRQENIDALSKALGSFKLDHPNSTPIDFINEINLYTAAEKTKLSETPSVHLMTVHMAKGKEYDTVFLYNFNEGVIPSPNSLLMPGGLEEERRIAYVAMTRAKENLFITCTQDKFHSYNRFRSSAPSRFLKELSSYKDVYHNFKSTSNTDVEWYNSKLIKTGYYDQEPVDNSKIYTNTYKYKVGDVVVHTTFGSGIVVKVDGTMIDVIFKAPYGKKTLVASHRALKRVAS